MEISPEKRHMDISPEKQQQQGVDIPQSPMEVNIKYDLRLNLVDEAGNPAVKAVSRDNKTNWEKIDILGDSGLSKYRSNGPYTTLKNLKTHHMNIIRKGIDDYISVLKKHDPPELIYEFKNCIFDVSMTDGSFIETKEVPPGSLNFINIYDIRKIEKVKINCTMMVKYRVIETKGIGFRFENITVRLFDHEHRKNHYELGHQFDEYKSFILSPKTIENIDISYPATLKQDMTPMINKQLSIQTPAYVIIDGNTVIQYTIFILKNLFEKGAFRNNNFDDLNKLHHDYPFDVYIQDPYFDTTGVKRLRVSPSKYYRAGEGSYIIIEYDMNLQAEGQQELLSSKKKIIEDTDEKWNSIYDMTIGVPSDPFRKVSRVYPKYQ